MSFRAGQKVILKMNDVQIGIGEVVLGECNPETTRSGQIFIRALKVEYGLDQIVIDYPNNGDCIGDTAGSPIPWDIENLIMCSNDILESSIDSSAGRTEFEIDDEEMDEPGNIGPELTRSSDCQTPIMLKPLDSVAESYPTRSQWRHRICNLEDKEGVVLATGRIYACLPDEVFVMDKIGPNHVGVMVINAVPQQGDQIMSMRLWPLNETRFVGGLRLSEIEAFLCENPSSESEDEFFSGVKKTPYHSSIRTKKISDKVPKISRLLDVGSIRTVSAQECCSENCCQLFPWASTQLVRANYWRKTFDERREWGTEVFSRIQSIGSGQGVVLEGRNICLSAWWKIHGISRATFMAYKQRYKTGKRSSTHGNTGMRKPRARTIQAQATIESIIRMNADQMPHQMKGTGNGRQDIRKVLPAHLTWEKVREEVNEVSILELDEIILKSQWHRETSRCQCMMYCFSECFCESLWQQQM